MSVQVNIRVDDALIAELDKEASKRGVSRPEVVREVLTEWRKRRAEEKIAEQYRIAYTECPETEEEMRWAEDAARRFVAEEPWEKWW